MPFVRGHYYIVLLLVITGIGFWPNYFSSLGEAPVAHHAHGITATLWIFLLIWQSWTIHNKKRKQHVVAGKISFVLVPLFLASGNWVTKVTIINDTAFTKMMGISLAGIDLASVVFVAICFYLAMKHRKNVQLHSRYLLATAFPLIGPALARVIAFFVLEMKDGLDSFKTALDITIMIILVLNLFLLWRDYKAGKPLAPFGFMLAFSLTFPLFFYWLGHTQVWDTWIRSYAGIDTPILLGAGMIMGLLSGYFGWQAGKQS